MDFYDGLQITIKNIKKTTSNAGQLADKHLVWKYGWNIQNRKKWSIDAGLEVGIFFVHVGKFWTKLVL